MFLYKALIQGISFALKNILCLDLTLNALSGIRDLQSQMEYDP